MTHREVMASLSPKRPSRIGLFFDVIGEMHEAWWNLISFNWFPKSTEESVKESMDQAAQDIRDAFHRLSREVDNGTWTRSE